MRSRETVRSYRSWGRYPEAVHRRVVPVRWRTEPPAWAELEGPVLPFACGRSYGDSCLNHEGTLLDVAPLKRFVAFDRERGLLRSEAGVTLADVLELVVPHGWFPPVVPGTRWVSVGGAIANDIHGKNHHRAGSFGSHVTAFELLRSTGERLVCSRESNADLFRATIGGLGLTGLLTWAEFRLKPIESPWIDMERLRFGRLAEFFELSASDRDYEYTVAWVDGLARGDSLGRGLFLRGDHASAAGADRTAMPRTAAGGRAPRRDRGGSGLTRRPALRVPFDLPAGLLNPLTVAVFNALYYRSQFRSTVRKRVPYEPFFFPLDKVRDWNRLYGRKGFLQHQCVVPEETARDGVRAVLDRIGRSREPSSLGVLKRFGSVPSPGLLSFPRPGVTVALDFPFRGRRTLDLLEELDGIVRDAGGAVYPAKDARMSGESFRAFFPQWERFAAHVDPRFSSSFWRRVTEP